MVWCARNTPLADGRTTFDLLIHADSRDALLVAENFANNKATQEELNAAEIAAEIAQAVEFKRIVKNPFM